MTSQVELPENWDEIQAMPENNGDARGDKVDAIHNFMVKNRIDSSDFENQGVLIWPEKKDRRDWARAQKKQLAAMSQAVNSSMAYGGSPGYVPQSPLYDFDQPGTPMSEIDLGGKQDDMDMDMDDDDNGKQTPPPVQQMPQPSAPPVQQMPQPSAPPAQPIAPPPVAITNIVNTNAFGPYQARVEEAMAAIREIEQGASFREMQIEQLEAIIRNVYEVFFGVDYTTGQPTAFHLEHGAAPIAGMSLPEVVTQARTAKAAQLEQQRMQESVFGFFRTYLQPLIQRKSQLEQQGNKMSDHAWSQRGADSGLGDPLSIIEQLMTVLQEVHEAADLLVRSDPLFIANRSERAQQGHLRVRGFWGQNTYAIARAGYSVLRNAIGAIVPAIAVQMDAMMPAAYRSGSLAIMNFESALARFDHLYQNLPAWAHLCWTLPFSPASPNYRAELPRWQNKPGAEQAQQAIQQRDFQLLMMARGSITEHFDPATYMAALTTNAVPNPTPPPRFRTVVNGPLLAYYYALHGGRMLYLRRGREWLQLAFLQNPARFIQELGNLRDTMAHIHSRFPRRHGQERGAPVIAEGSAEQQDARMLMNRNVSPQQRAAAEQRLLAYFRGLVGTGQVGTTHAAVPTYLCRPQETVGTCTQRLRNQAGNFAAAIQQYVNPQYSSQQGATPLRVEDLLSGSTPEQQYQFRQQMAATLTREAGQKQAAINQSRDQMALTRQLMRGIRAAANEALQQGQTTSLMQLPSIQSVANLRSASTDRLERIANALIGEPNGLLAILNSPVYLYTRETTSRYNRGEPKQLFRILDNNFGFRPINYAQLEQNLRIVGTTFIRAAEVNDSIRSNSEEFAIDPNTVHNIALRILDNDYWNRLLGMTLGQLRAAITNIRRHGTGFRGGPNTGRINPDAASNNNPSRGGRKGKKTRKHKKKKKKTRRRKMKRKRTRHHRKRKKHTRKR